MSLNFWCVLDVNKNKFYCNILFYLIVKRLWLWLLMQSVTIHLCKVSHIFLYHIVLCVVWLFLLYFYCYFCNWSFPKTLWSRHSLVMLFHCLSLRNTLGVFRIKTKWRSRENVISALFGRGIHVECL